MDIRFRDDDETRRINEAFEARFKRLSGGFSWPPANATEWRIILTRAGFTPGYIDRVLATFGCEGYEGVSELLPAYSSASEASGELPAFLVQLLENLERWYHDAAIVRQEESRRSKIAAQTKQQNECYTELHPKYQTAVDELMATGLSYTKATEKAAGDLGVSARTVQRRTENKAPRHRSRHNRE